MISFHFISFHFISFHFISFHFIPLNSTQLNSTQLDSTRRNATYRPWNHRSLTGHFDCLSSGWITHKLIVCSFCDRFLAQTRRCSRQIRRRARGWNLESIVVVFLVEGKGGNTICAEGRQNDNGK
jgi:hypothetical protein